MVLAPNPYLLAQPTLPPFNTHQIMKAKTIIKQLLDQEQTGQWVETPDFQDISKIQWLIDYFGMKILKAGTIEPNTMYVVTWGDSNKLNGVADAIIQDHYTQNIYLYKVED